MHKRRRIMDAIAKLSAERGYEATTIADIVRSAGVARKTLYDNFEGKEDVFLAAFDEAVAELFGQVEAACAAVEGSWPERVEAALEAFLRYFAERPAAAKMCMIEALAATPASSRHYEETVERFAALVREAGPDESGIPDTTAEILVGGVSWIVYQQIRRGETERCLDLLPELTEFVCAPYGR
ncbi:MAG TPA: TetR/AcrR family transcriptional regulator [Solirubrobacterales bacterium]|nr:TetR/AcrR family transcriptional regulator [Solirubrobacterales bacterium]